MLKDSLYDFLFRPDDFSDPIIHSVMVKDIRIEDFDYTLPDARIARYPLEKRDECRLLLRTPDGHIFHRKFKELPELMPPGSLMVCNETKVVRARLPFYKESGAAIEIFLLEPIAPADYALNFQSKERCSWKCLVGNLKKWKEGDLKLKVDTEVGKETELKVSKIKTLAEGGVEVEFHWNNAEINFSELIESVGKIPIPPYLNRESEERDLQDYQTVYARKEGSVAAPTAGLHFTPEVFAGLRAHAVRIEKLSLHVGAGTFRPVKSETIGDHPMHSERFSVSRGLIEALLYRKLSKAPVVAVGTTSVRTLESLPYIAEKMRRGTADPFYIEQWMAYSAEFSDFDTTEALSYMLAQMKADGKEELTASTSIMIAPGFKWRVVDGMVTNFHQPKSTLLLLVSSFIGDSRGGWKKVYEEALKENYRFLSYGDACLFIK